MQRLTIIIIIALVIIAVLLGAYLLFTNLSKDNSPSGQANNAPAPQNFEIQGMKVQILAVGGGGAAKDGDSVTVNYVGTLADGTKFDSSVDRNAPFTFPLGQGRVIPGWDLGVVGMKTGEKRKLIIPPDLAYGPAGFLTIPPNATLTFEVELLKIN